MISKTERGELQRLVRQRFKVLRADIAQRETELLAELEDRLNTRFAADEKGWADVGFAIQQAVDEASRKANDLVREYVGREAWPHDARIVYFHGTVAIRQEIAKTQPDRSVLRRTGQAHITATIKAACLELDRQEVDLLTRLATTALESDDAREFLGAIPTVSALVPASRLLELEQSLHDGK